MLTEFFLHRRKAAADVHRPSNSMHYLQWCINYLKGLWKPPLQNPRPATAYYTTAVWALGIWLYTARNYCVLLHHCRVSAVALNVASDIAWTRGRSILMEIHSMYILYYER